MKIRFLGLACLILAAIGAGFILIVRAGWLNPTYAEVQARYADAPSTFANVDGARLHVRDEGNGPILVLLHGSYTNLHLWDPWVERLKDRYRVIRLDWPTYGLSTDPTGRYDNPRSVELLEGLMQQKGIAHFTLAGTSTGALIAILYAERHPEKVDALALSTVPIFPTKGEMRPDKVMAAIRWVHDTLAPNYYPRAYFKRSLQQIISVPSARNQDILDQFYYMNNLPGGYARQDIYAENLAGNFSAAAEAAKAITAPVLIQWGDGDTVLLAGEGDKASTAFPKASVEVIHYPGVGHFPMWEIPDQSVRDLETFLSHAKEGAR